MASYDAQINILVAGQRNIQNLANQLGVIEETITQIERRWRAASAALQRSDVRLNVVGRSQPRGPGGRGFGPDPDRRARFAAYADRRRAAVEQRLARLALRRGVDEAALTRDRINDNRELLRQTERRITFESRLNSANLLFQRKAQQFRRSGAGTNLPEELRSQVRSIEAAYDAAGGAGSRNLRLIQSLATEYGRLVERQNEFNRLQSLGSKGFEAGRRLQERITAATEKAALPRQQVTRVRGLAAEVIAAARSGDQQAYTEAVRRATAATSRLERQSRTLADALKLQENNARIALRNAPRSPIRGSVSMPGSPKAVEFEERRIKARENEAVKIAKRKSAQIQSETRAAVSLAQQKMREEEKQIQDSIKNAPRSPIRGSVNMPGSPRAIEEAERIAKIEDSRRQRAIKEQQRRIKAQEKEAARIAKAQSRQLQSETRAAVSLAQQKMREEEKATADAWKMRGGPALPPGFTEAGRIKQRGETLPLTAPKTLRNTIRSGEIIEQKIVNLQNKGVDVTSELKTLQETLNAAKQKDFVITKNTLDLLIDQVGVAGHFLRLQRAMGAGQGGKGGRSVGPEGTGLEQALERLREARGARLSFFGDVSPAEAIDKIVREFNGSADDVKAAADNVTTTLATELKAGSPKAKAAGGQVAEGIKDGINDALGIASPSKFIIQVVQILAKTWENELKAASPRLQLAAERAFGLSGPKRMAQRFVNTIEGKKVVPSTNYRPLPVRNSDPSAMGPEMDAMERRFRKQIAALSTQPEIYGNLLNALPSSRISMALVGAANERAGMVENFPEFLPRLRRIEAFGGPKSVSESGIDIFGLENEIKKTFAQYLRDIKIPNPWVGPIGDYKEFIGSIEFETKRLESQPLLAGSRVAGALPPATQSAADVRNRRIERAYRRSAERGLRVLSEDAFGGSGQRSLRPFSFGFGADPARIRNLMARGSRGRLALPGGVEAQATTITAEGRSLRAAVRDFFNRIRTGVADAAGGIFGGGGGGTRPPIAGGAPGRDPGDLYARASAAAQQGPEALLGLEELRRPNRATINELNALSAVLTEFRANLDPVSAEFGRFDDELREAIANLGRIQQQRAPEADFLTRRFDPRVARGMSEGLIGGAFPLLFGQGTGASIGGGIGGFAGGFAGGGLGFGLSLVGTAVGTAVDTFITNLKGLASSLDDPTAALEAMKVAGMGASKETEKMVKTLVESGNVYRAQSLVIDEINNKLGVNGVKMLQAYEKQQQMLNNQFQQLSASITSSVLPAIVGFNALIQDTLSILGMGGGQKTLDKVVDFAITAYLAQLSLFLGPGVIAGYQGLKERGRLAAEGESGRPGMKEEVLLASELAKYQKQIESINIGKSLIDQVRQASREQQDLDKQRLDLIRSYEESIAQIRERVEDEIAGRRFAILEKENELLDLQGQNRIKKLELETQRIIAAAGAGQPEQVVDIAKKTAEIVGTFTQQQLTAAEEEAKIRRDSKLEEKQFDFEAAKFKVGIAKEVARLNLETAKQVQAINEQVVRRNEDADNRRFKLEQDIALIQIRQSLYTAKNDLELMKKVQRENPLSGITSKEISDQQEYVKAVMQGFNAVRDLKPPAKLKTVPGVANMTVSTSSLDKVIADQGAAIDRLVKEKLVGVDLTKEINIEEFKDGMKGIRDEIEQFFRENKEGFEKNLQQKMRISKFIRMGYSEELAQKAARIEQEKELLELSYQGSILELEKSKQGKTKAEQAVIDEQIRIMRGRLNMSGGIADAALFDAMQEFDPRAEIETERDLIQSQLNDLLKTSYQVTAAAGAIGDAFGQSFRGIVDGSMTVNQALASLFQSVANHFLDMATQIIAKWIQMAVLNTVLSIWPGSSGGAGGVGGGGPFNMFTQFSTLGQSTFPIGTGYALQNANGNAFDANGIVPFAKGGMFTNSVVSSPTLFKFADGAAMRTGVMGEAGSEAIMPLTRGPGGVLGVQSYGDGGGDVNVTIHVDATGTKVAGDDANANQLGRAITAAVQAEIVKQKRPGGLLSN